MKQPFVNNARDARRQTGIATATAQSPPASVRPSSAMKLPAALGVNRVGTFDVRRLVGEA
jgi:hypothetical protein